jgi:ATP-binding cassette subfamily B protein
MNTNKNAHVGVVRYFWQKAWFERKYVIGILLVMPFNVLLNQIIPPIIMANVLNRLASHHYIDGDIWHSFGTPLVLYAIAVLIGSFSWRIIDLFQWRLEGNVEKTMGAEVFSHLLSQSARFHADHFSGSLVSQTNKLMSSYIRFADTTSFVILPLILGLFFSLIVLTKVAPFFALILFAFAIIYTVSAIFITRKTRRLSAKHAQIESAQTGALADAISNTMVVKSFAGQKFEERQFKRYLGNTRSSLFQFGAAHQRQQLYFGTLLSGISALSLLGAAAAVLKFDANVATVFLIFNYTTIIGEQLFGFSNNALRNYNRSIGDASDMVAILQTKPEVLDPVVPKKLQAKHGDIVFDDVTFSHSESTDALFNGLNLHIKSGEKIGLVGHSGSGKTTFTRILLRFSDIQAGQIHIDGQDIATVTQDDLHSAIAYVPQEPLLFHRSVRENIAYGNLAANDEAIEATARMAHADEFIRELAQGYDTLVGERGVKLSGGQRQRIAIARAMLKNAPILVLDEATSALDSESEVLIQDALWKLMEGRTAIVIAHRLSTIQKMDRILVLNEGRIIEEGTHHELIGKNGMYAKLWAHQSGGFMED